MKSDMTREELLDDTIKLVKGEKKNRKWDQETWVGIQKSARSRFKYRSKFDATACGTTACVAGNVAIAAGYIPHKAVVSASYWDKNELRVTDDCAWGRPQGPTRYSISALAATLLGLTYGEADYLFGDQRTKREVSSCLKILRRGGDIKATKGFKVYAIDSEQWDPRWNDLVVAKGWKE